MDHVLLRLFPRGKNQREISNLCVFAARIREKTKSDFVAFEVFEKKKKAKAREIGNERIGIHPLDLFSGVQNCFPDDRTKEVIH